MSRINAFTGPRVQAPTTPATSGPGRTGFGSLLQAGGAGAGPRPGDPLMVSGGAVVASALSSVSSSSHSGVLNSYLAAVGKGPINADGTRGAAPGSTAPAGSEQAKQEAALIELAELSAATLANSIFHMGNNPKLQLDRE